MVCSYTRAMGSAIATEVAGIRTSDYSRLYHNSDYGLQPCTGVITQAEKPEQLADARPYHDSKCDLQPHEDNEAGHHYKGFGDQDLHSKHVLQQHQGVGAGLCSISDHFPEHHCMMIIVLPLQGPSCQFCFNTPESPATSFIYLLLWSYWSVWQLFICKSSCIDWLEICSRTHRFRGYSASQGYFLTGSWGKM